MTGIASVDLGTNSTRVLVGLSTGAGLEVLDRRNTITRLGQDVGASGRLAPEAVARTLDCLRGYREILDRHRVERLGGPAPPRPPPPPPPRGCLPPGRGAGR